MKTEEFCNKLVKYAPYLLMDKPKSKIEVIFVDDKMRRTVGFRCEHDHFRKTSTIYLVPKHATHASFLTKSQSDYKCELKMLLNDLKRAPDGYELHVKDPSEIVHELLDLDPFEAYDSLCFKVSGSFM